MTFRTLFASPKPLIACLHLLPLPGSPRYGGSMDPVYDTALAEVERFARYGVDGFIVENFRDTPYYPGRLPPETIASLATVSREVVNVAQVPVGINALRHDAPAAMAIAAAAQAHFIRVNVHMDAVASDQGILQGSSHETLRLRSYLHANVLVFADASVKHATPMGHRGLAAEVQDLTERGLADAIIVSGTATGSETRPEDVDTVRRHTHVPVLIGSGATPDNLAAVYHNADGFIVGSYFKRDGKAENAVEEGRIKTFADAWRALSS
jgi:uncharacterized protein